MNVVDSSAWLPYFAGDGNARLFAKPIEALDKLLVPSITIAEVFKCVLRQRNEEAAIEAVAHMEQGTVIELNGEFALNSAVFGVEFSLPLRIALFMQWLKKIAQ